MFQETGYCEKLPKKHFNIKIFKQLIDVIYAINSISKEIFKAKIIAEHKHKNKQSLCAHKKN